MDSIYDHTLQEIGYEDKYQKRFDIVYNIFFMALWSMAYTNIILTMAVTPHTCKIPENPQNVSLEEWKIRIIPRLEDIKGENKFDSCLIYSNPYENNETKACQEYTYDKTWYESTVPSEHNWVCDKKMYVLNIMAYMKIAEVVGSAFFGWFGDAYGRRITYIISVAMLVAGRMISLAAGDSYIFFVIGCCIAHLPSWAAPQSLSVISTEISSQKHRNTITTMRYTVFSIGLFILGLLYWWLREWKIFVIVTTVPLVPYLIMSWTMIESPRWLYTQGRKQEMIKLLRRIAKINKKSIKINTEKDLLSSDSNDKPQVFGFFMLFSGWRLTLNTTLIMLLWLITTLNYGYLLLSAGERTDANPFLDFSWQALTEMPAIFFGAWLSDNIGRRYSGVSSYSTTVVIWILIAIRENSSGDWIRKWWIGSLLTIAARLSTNVSFFVLNLLTMEFYPTSLRQTGMSLGNVFSSAAIAISPYILHLGRSDPRLPAVILAITSLAGLGFSFLLPETLNAKLPETIQEAKMFGKKVDKLDQEQLKPITT